MTILGSAVASALRDPKSKKLRFKSLDLWATEPNRLVKEIVELRGHLRHHSLGNPRRWDPDKQEDYEPEARFLAQVVHSLIWPMTTGKLWEPSLMKEYVRL